MYFTQAKQTYRNLKVYCFRESFRILNKSTSSLFAPLGSYRLENVVDLLNNILEVQRIG